MNIHLRMFKVFMAAFLRRETQQDALETFSKIMRVWPMDLDFNLHKNNGRYLTCMDVGRMDMAFRSGLYKPMLKHKWMPLLGSSTIRYFRSLGLFQKFDLQTRIVGWDEKWVFIEQRFVSKGQIYAVAAVKVLFRGPKGNVPTQTLMDYAGINQESPVVPEWVAAWHKADQALGQEIRK